MLTSNSLLEIATGVFNASEKKNLYFIIDMAAVIKWPDDFWPLHSGAYNKVASLFGECGAPEHDESAPFLIQLSEDNLLSKFLFEEAEKKPLGIFLASFKNWQQTYNETQSWLWPKRINGERIFFRYYDPRVMTPIAHYFRDADQPLPLSSFEEFFWHDPAHEANFHLVNEILLPSLSMKNTWLLEPDLEEALIEAHMPHRIMDMLKEADSRFVQLRAPEFYQRINFMLKDAAAYNIMEIKDLLHFCHLSFMFPGFISHPGTQEKLMRFSLDRKQKFYDVTKSLPDSWLAPYRSKELI